MSPQSPVNLFDLDRNGLQDLFVSLGEKPFRASQVMKWVYHRGVTEFERMSDLGKSLRARLAQEARLHVPGLFPGHESGDGTRKWLLPVDSGNCVETVLIPEPGRVTLCVSSQVGCALDCSFCATGQQGFNRNLRTAEIVAQLWQVSHLQSSRRVSNVVFMGMGEPLANFDNVVRALNIMQDDCGFGLSRRRVTLSTSGIVPAIERLAAVSNVSLAVSLHAPDDELRNVLVPLNRKYPIAELMQVCKRYCGAQAGRKQRITWEYVMIDGLNDEDRLARLLVERIKGIPSKVNLIPFNPFPGTSYRRSPQKRIDRFREILIDAGITTVTRRPRGDDIAAACGQLAGQVQNRSRRRGVNQHIQVSP